MNAITPLKVFAPFRTRWCGVEQPHQQDAEYPTVRGGFTGVMVAFNDVQEIARDAPHA